MPIYIEQQDILQHYNVYLVCGVGCSVCICTDIHWSVNNWSILKNRKRDILLDELNGVLVASVANGNLKFGSDMSDEGAWALLMMSLVSQSYKLGLKKSSAHELLDEAWGRAEEAE